MLQKSWFDKNKGTCVFGFEEVFSHGKIPGSTPAVYEKSGGQSGPIF